MNIKFYLKIAITNMRKNGRLYFPYCLASISIVSMFYILNSIYENEGILSMPGAGNLKILLGLGCNVVGLFSGILLFYTNNFLMKQRKREIGLYNVLGMGKGHLSAVLFFEAIILYLINIGLGLISGLVVSKLVFLILLKMLKCTIPITYVIEKSAIFTTIILFSFIFMLILLCNIFQIKKSNPIDLLKSSNVGEREPKTRWLIALIGIISMALGYGIALSIKAPLVAMMLFFIAVILVIIGTYALFTAGSIVALKILRKNKEYYYKTKNFIGISGMIYRMKKNAIGLANICILSTMVLVTLSTTVCLYMGQNNVISNYYPREVRINVGDADIDTKEQILQIINDLEKDGVKKAKNIASFNFCTYTTARSGNDFSGLDGKEINYQVFFMSLDEYNQMNNTRFKLNDNQIMIYSESKYKGNDFSIMGEKFEIKEQLEEFDFSFTSAMGLYESLYVILPSNQSFESIKDTINSHFGNEGIRECAIAFDYQKGGEEGKSFVEEIKGAMKQQNINAYILTKENMEAEYFAIFGGFLFIGMFLGAMFVMATVLIIYYKQISEGYEDRQRFQIMQKVGLTPKEVKASIKNQILIVFFLPLIVAVLHVAAAFNMMTKLLSLFSLTDINLFFLCTVSTIGVFAIIYVAVYSMTAKAYYRIVK
ncbi:MAG: FtsX-like permease family protein [Aminipila sp.]